MALIQDRLQTHERVVCDDHERRYAETFFNLTQHKGLECLTQLVDFIFADLDRFDLECGGGSEYGTIQRG